MSGWRAAESSPKRDKQSLLYIAKIISRFDVVALQEVRGNLSALHHVLRLLGPPSLQPVLQPGRWL